MPVLLYFSLLLAQALAADDLPPGVPRIVNPDGSLCFVEPAFTTREFRNEALRLVIEEANKVAKELNLPESFPITRTNLMDAFISGFGYMLDRRAVGTITTSNYWYGIGRDYKFSGLTVANYDARCFEYRDKYRLPVSQIDTNAAYHLAMQWLAAAGMDVNGLNRDCEARVAVSPYWNGLDKLGEKPREQTFAPIYYVWWRSAKNRADEQDGPASVELLLPTKTLIQLSVDDPKYILRKPVVFTNLAALFPGKATIKTNWPVKPEIIDLGPP
jgi:hypothetical protein